MIDAEEISAFPTQKSSPSPNIGLVCFMLAHCFGFGLGA